LVMRQTLLHHPLTSFGEVTEILQN